MQRQGPVLGYRPNKKQKQQSTSRALQSQRQAWMDRLAADAAQEVLTITSLALGCAQDQLICWKVWSAYSVVLLLAQTHTAVNRHCLKLHSMLVKHPTVQAVVCPCFVGVTHLSC